MMGDCDELATELFHMVPIKNQQSQFHKLGVFCSSSHLQLLGPPHTTPPYLRLLSDWLFQIQPDPLNSRSLSKKRKVTTMVKTARWKGKVTAVNEPMKISSYQVGHDDCSICIFTRHWITPFSALQDLGERGVTSCQSALLHKPNMTMSCHCCLPF